MGHVGVLSFPSLPHLSVLFNGKAETLHLNNQDTLRRDKGDGVDPDPPPNSSLNKGLRQFVFLTSSSQVTHPFCFVDSILVLCRYLSRGAGVRHNGVGRIERESER